MALNRAYTWFRSRGRSPDDVRCAPLPRSLVRVLSDTELESALDRAMGFERPGADRAAARMHRYEQMNSRPKLVEMPTADLGSH
ncbi:MAG: hypothetical protein JWO62_236, partial [Acidimicrobiaceae bacterium]|nr:hypothetical protein [Acidimicrobiaceae bacterium]